MVHIRIMNYWSPIKRSQLLIGNKLDESQGNYTAYKKPISKGYVLHYSTDTAFLFEQQNNGSNLHANLWASC